MQTTIGCRRVYQFFFLSTSIFIVTPNFLLPYIEWVRKNNKAKKVKYGLR